MNKRSVIGGFGVLVVLGLMVYISMPIPAKSYNFTKGFKQTEVIWYPLPYGVSKEVWISEKSNFLITAQTIERELGASNSRFPDKVFRDQDLVSITWGNVEVYNGTVREYKPEEHDATYIVPHKYGGRNKVLRFDPSNSVSIIIDRRDDRVIFVAARWFYRNWGYKWF